MNKTWKKLSAIIVTIAMLSNMAAVQVLAAPRNVSQEAKEVLFSTSFETSTGFLETTQATDAQGNPRIKNVDGNMLSAIKGDLTSFVQIASLQGSKDHNTSETKDKIFDSNLSTKWLSNANIPSTSQPIWISFSLSESKIVRAYAIASANDASARDPKAWVFSGSTDGVNWTELDSQSDISFSERYQQKIFEFDNETAYSHYKLDITANRSNDSMTQFSELTLASMEEDAEVPPSPMITKIETGPRETWNQAANRGWTGSKALTVQGSQVAHSEGGYAYNVIYKDLNIPVTEHTKLRYLIFPQYVGSYDFDYTSMHIAVDIEFTDGTYLSESTAVDQNGNGVSPLAQGKSRTLTTRQWNEIYTYLVSGNLVGKTIDKILVGYENDLLTAGIGANILAYIDDIEIVNQKPLISDHLSDYVYILRGTNDNTTFSRGLTSPSVNVPYAFNFWTPATNVDNSKNYDYQDTQLQYITVSHEPSYWMGDRGTWQFMVNTTATPGTASTSQRGATFSHDNEIAKAHYYSVEFTEGNAAGSQMEITPTDHGAVARFTFDPGVARRNVIFDSARAGGGITINGDNKSFTAYSDHNSLGMQRMYVYGEFDTEFTNKATSGKVGMVSFPTTADQVTLRVATSFVSYDQAKKNLDMEIGAKSFDDVYTEAQKIWDEKLGIIEVEGATEDQMISLYSNLYRLFSFPNSLSEYTGDGDKDGWQYRSPYSPHGIVDGKMYYNNGFWDTYRTTWAAYALLDPEMTPELLDGLVQHFVDKDWIPRWIAPAGRQIMVGTSSDVIFGDAVARGFEFDIENAYWSSVKNAAVSTKDPNGEGIGRNGYNTAIFDGFTSNAVGEGMSWALEGYINDYGIAQMAKHLGDKDADLYYSNRALNYINLFSEELGGWFSGKSRAGDWSYGPDVFDPTRWGGDYTETNAWNMAFSITQDGQGLANLYGGRDKLAEKLDAFFTAEGTYNPGSYGGDIHEMKEAREVKLGQYGHSNQPSHHIPYMYLYAGRPDRTQEVVRDVLDRVYVGSGFGQGYPGDEDNGEMSAWYILSALGIYPLNMGSGQFVIGAPLFTKATVKVGEGKELVIDAPNNSRENIYVQGVTLNGDAYEKTYFEHADLAKGGNIVFDMGNTPSTWGSGEDALPPSLTEGDKVANPLKDLTSIQPNVVDEMTVSDPWNSVYSAEAVALGKLFDNTSDTESSFVLNENKSASIIYKFAVPTYVELYTLTSTANPEKAPTSFALYGSNDLENWDELDSRLNESFRWDKYTRPFAVADDKKSEAYQYFRLQFSGEGDTVELAEIELWGDIERIIDVRYLELLVNELRDADRELNPPYLGEEMDDALVKGEAVLADPDVTRENLLEAVRALESVLAKVRMPVRDPYVNPLEAETFDSSNGVAVDTNSSASGGFNIGGVLHGKWIKFNKMNFGRAGATHVKMHYSSSSSGNEAMPGFAEIIFDSLENEPVARIPTQHTGEKWSNYVTVDLDLNPELINGTHDVYVRFVSQEGRYVCNVDYFIFTKGEESPVDKTALQELYDDELALDRDAQAYTTDSWDVYAKAMNDTLVVLDNEDATQEQVKKMFDDLQAAVEALVKVDGEEIPVSKIKINASGLFTLSIKKTAQIPVVVEPTDATDQTVQWISTNTNIFTVDKDGNIIPHKQGIATLTAQASNGLKSTIIVRITA